MRRYQKLIQDAVGGDSESHSPAKKSGYNILAREMGAPGTSVHEWATFPHKVPAHKSLERLAAYFKVPLPTLLMEADDPKLPIVEALYQADMEQIHAVASLLGIKL